jgi:hypothetical protein
LSENLKGRDHSEDIDVDGKIVDWTLWECGGKVCRWEDSRMDLVGMWWEGVVWIYLAQNRDQWRTFVNTVMNFRVSYRTSFLD